MLNRWDILCRVHVGCITLTCCIRCWKVCVICNCVRECVCVCCVCKRGLCM